MPSDEKGASRAAEELGNLVKAMRTNRVARSFIEFSFPRADGTLNLATPHEEAYDASYRNGDFYALWGNLEEDKVYGEMKTVVSWIRWMAFRGFKVVLNPAADLPSIREAVSNPRAKGFFWSSHGAPSGKVWDAAGVLVPQDIFAKNKSPSLQYGVWSACHGDKAMAYYDVSAIKVTFWSGLTSLSDAWTFLQSPRFDQKLADIGANISPKFPRKQ